MLLQDARTRLTDIANDCELSTTAVLNRIKRMKKSGLIIKSALYVNMVYLGFPYLLLIGVNVEPFREPDIVKLIKKHALVAGIDRTLGKYDLCLFVFAKNLDDLDRLKHLIRKQKGVMGIEINIWNKFHFNYGNIKLTYKMEAELDG